MNRSILIVICDFLLLSLLTFSTDINHISGDNALRTAKVEVTTNDLAQPGKELATLMQQALTDERKSREQLQQQLATARATAGSQQEQLTRAAQENTRLQQQSAGLQQEFAVAQTNVENLTRQLQNTTAQAQATREKLAVTEAEAQKQTAQAIALKQEVDLLARSNQLAQTEDLRLANQLQVAEAERRAALERASLLQQEVATAHAENVRLAEGFKSLATNSSQLTQEIRQNRALAPNTIFNEFVSNRVHTTLAAVRSGLLGDVNKDRQTATLLVTDGTNICALCHVDDTPLTLWDPGTDWNGLTGTFTGAASTAAVHAMAFHQSDPRVVMFPLNAAEARQLGSKVYRISSDPYKFQDAVLIGADSGYYGECNFQIELNSPQYVKLDRNLIKGLFGKFNPSRGDVVFSRTGELLGIMVNSSYCLMIHNFTASATVTFGPDIRAQHTGGTLARLFGDVFQMPQRLQ